jgi:hypothetical protein
MNERIQELAVQVYGSAATAQEIKFAELIVKEVESYIQEAEGDIDLVQFLIDRYLK